MGCGIHVFGESLNKEKNQWEEVYYGTGYNSCTRRNYALFGVLAHVRWNYPPPCSLQPNGFPEDASEEVKSEFSDWGYDAHTPCHRTIEELEHLYNSLPIYLLTNSNNVLPDLKELIKKFKDPGIPSDEQRIIFWFDN